MNWSRLGGVVVVVLCAVPLLAATPEQLRQTIDKAKGYLYEKQDPDGTWEQEWGIHGEQKSGQTALAVYALLSAGESRQDERIAKAIEYIKKTETTGVYALGVRCQVWLMLPPTPDVRALMSRDAKLLIQSVKRKGEGQGFYDYNLGTRNTYSHSRAQYGVLGAWAASQMGIEVPRDYWQLVEKSWVGHQDPSGGWNYQYKRDQYPVTPGMTAVGVATLFITQDYLHATEGLTGGGNVRNPAIERGMKWMTDNFSKVASEERYERAYPLATLYAVERIGVASGIKYFGDVDWYDKGAEYLVKNQQSDGSFREEYDTKIAPTSFGILFLARGAAPIVMNKLDYSAAKTQATTRAVGRNTSEMNWNQRPRDVANITRWIGRQVERDLNWQIVTPDSPLGDLLEAPILYMAGNQPIEFTPEQESRLRDFVLQGGFIVGNADVASANFAGAFRALGQKLFYPYEFASLPENHVIYTNQQFQRSKWKRKPTVLALGNGARLFMMLLPDADPARAWQTRNTGGKEELFELPANVFLYAVDKRGLHRRGEGHFVELNDRIKPTKTIKLARLQYNGNWNPEPGGWKRLAAVLNNEQKIDLTVEPVKLGDSKLAGYKLAHLTGTTGFTLDAKSRDELKGFVAAGGTLLVDSTGGATEFSTAVETELAAIFPEASSQLNEIIPVEDALYTAGGYTLKPVEYRNYARTKVGQLKVPQLRGIRSGDRLTVIHSREDLSVGLVGQPVDGIVGYDPATATELMMRAILFTQK